jgi:hypothetical protein
MMQGETKRSQRSIYILIGGITGAVVGYAMSLPIYAFGKAAEFRALVPAAIALITGVLIGLASIYGRRRLLFVVVGTALGVIAGMFLTVCCALVFDLNVSLDSSVTLNPISAIFLVLVWVVTGLIVGCLFVLPIFQSGEGDGSR